MCGISWCLINNNLIEILIESFNTLAHRGPDAHCFEIEKNSFWGCHRLAITNLNDNGNQPLKIGHTILICNGQIWNYLELADLYGIDRNQLRTDVDIILHLYAKGIDIKTILDQLDGDYAFVLGDGERIIAARDPVGVRPLFIGTDLTFQNVIGFSSEIKFFNHLNQIKSVLRFPPGYYYLDGKFRKFSKLYHQITDNQLPNHDIISSLLERAVQKRIVNSDRNIALLLSGGIDSSLIVSIANKLSKKNQTKIHVFSIEFVDERSNSNDSIYATLLASELQLSHTAIKFTWQDVEDNLEEVIKYTETDDPNTIRASIPMYLLAKYLKNHSDYTVFLSGEGADEIFAGYNYFNRAPNNTALNTETRRLVENLHSFDVLRADRCFNAHGLELRVPFLDRDLIQYVMSIDGEYKMPFQGIEKHLLREVFTNQYPELVKTRIIDRVKEKFSDGCGYSYVPKLLNFFARETSKTLIEKEKDERRYYQNIFDRLYGEKQRDVIIKRKLPEWCGENTKDKNLLAA